MTDFERAAQILYESPADWSIYRPDPGEMGTLTILDGSNKKGIVLNFFSNGKFAGVSIKD